MKKIVLILSIVLASISQTFGIGNIKSDEVFARDFGEPSYATFTNALAKIGDKEKTLVVDGGEWAITDDVEVPSNVTLDVRKGSYFSGVGQITGLSYAKPEWWGAKPNTTNDSLPAITSAIGSSKNVYINGGSYLLNMDDYYNGQPIQITSQKYIDMSGSELVIKPLSETNSLRRSTLIQISSATNVTINGGSFIGRREYIGSVSSNYVYMEMTAIAVVGRSRDISISDCKFENIVRNCVYVNNYYNDSTNANIVINDCTFSKYAAFGILIESGDDVTISDNNFYGGYEIAYGGNYGSAIHMEDWNNDAEIKNIKVRDCYIKRSAINCNTRALLDNISIDNCQIYGHGFVSLQGNNSTGIVKNSTISNCRFIYDGVTKNSYSMPVPYIILGGNSENVSFNNNIIQYIDGYNQANDIYPLLIKENGYGVNKNLTFCNNEFIGVPCGPIIWCSSSTNSEVLRLSVFDNSVDTSTVFTNDVEYYGDAYSFIRTEDGDEVGVSKTSLYASNNKQFIDGVYCGEYSDISFPYSTYRNVGGLCFDSDGPAIAEAFVNVLCDDLIDYNDCSVLYTNHNLGSTAFLDATLAGDNNIYLLSGTQTNLYKLDATTKVLSLVTNFATEYNAIQVSYNNDYLVLAPSDAGSIAVYDIASGTTTLSTNTDIDSASYAIVPIPDNRFVFVPYDNSDIYVYSKTDDVVSVCSGNFGNQAFRDGVLLPDGKVALIPFRYNNMVLFDPDSLTYEIACEIEADDFYYRSAVFHESGNVILCPEVGTSIGIYNWATKLYYKSENVTLDSSDYNGGFLLPDGNIGLIPRNSNELAVYNVYTDNIIFPIDVKTDTSKVYIDSVIAGSGNIVFIPYNYSNIGFIDCGYSSLNGAEAKIINR